MPTGYTAKIREGVTFKEFALTCARAFGACITMKEESLETPIPDEFLPTDYYTNKIMDLTNKLKEYTEMDDIAWSEAARLYYKRKELQRNKHLQEMKDLECKYQNMLYSVNSWQAPSEDHKKLKQFMIKQLEDSITWDCDSTYYTEQTEQLSDAEFKYKTLTEVHEAIEYNIKMHNEEVERIKSRNEWVRLLRESL